MKASHHPASTDPDRGSSLPGTSQRNRSGIVLILVFMLLPILAHGAGPLRVATEGAYPPFNYLDEQGRLTGFDVDIARALCAALETECSFTAVPWEELIPRLEAGEYDVIVASMARTPEREQRVDFTEHYYHSRSAFVARSGSGLQPDRQNLRGKRLAAPVGSVQAEYLMRRYTDIADIVTPPTSGDAFAMLAAGESASTEPNKPATGARYRDKPWPHRTPHRMAGPPALHPPRLNRAASGWWPPHWSSAPCSWRCSPAPASWSARR